MTRLRKLRRIRREQGSAAVEMALSCLIYLAVLFGIVEIGLGVYTSTYVSYAAREASRYASVRGQTSCDDDVTADPNCNLLPTSTGNPLQAYVRQQVFPGISAPTVTATWWEPSQTAKGYSSWPTPCTGATDTTTGVACNALGNAVKVVVSAPVNINIPFWKKVSITVSSTSQMVINE